MSYTLRRIERQLEQGFVTWYFFFFKPIFNAAAIAKLLTKLLKKNVFDWSTRAEEYFNELKLAMTQAPTLALPNFSKLFVVKCDTS